MKSEHDVAFSKSKYYVLSLHLCVKEMSTLCEFWKIYQQNKLTG